MSSSSTSLYYYRLCWLLSILWLLLTILALISPKIPYLKKWSMHGKLLISKNTSTTSTAANWWLLEWFNNIYITKTHFRDFYLIGTLFNSIIIYCFYNILNTKKVITLLLLDIHLIRRLLEETINNNKCNNNGKMHITAYILGIMFYILMPLSILLSYNSDNYNILIYIICIIINIFAQYYQNRIHYLLNNIKYNNNGNYGIPYGNILFNYISSPHYTCEIIIYITLTIILYIPISTTSSTTSLSLLPFLYCTIFVIVNLSINAYNNHYWYKHKFDNYPKKRCAIIPFIL